MPVRSVSATSYAPDGERYDECKINIRQDESIVFEFTWRGERYTYEGRPKQNAPGKFVLTCAKAGGRIELYRLPDGDGFIGRFTERASGSGLWSIEYDDEP